MNNDLITVITPGHVYEVKNVDNGTQTITFITKEEQEDGTLKTTVDGTTNEALLQVLIDRIDFVSNLRPSDYNTQAIVSLKEALSALQARTADRIERGVEGTNKF